MRPIRNSAKAIIWRDGALLVTRNSDPWGGYFLLPGGGQHPGETLSDAVRRECREEVGADVTVGRLVAIREYISCHHEFADEDSDAHQVEFMFECRLTDGEEPSVGHEPDPGQTGILWVHADALPDLRLYPAALKPLLQTGFGPDCAYLGDVN